VTKENFLGGRKSQKVKPSELLDFGPFKTVPTDTAARVPLLVWLENLGEILEELEP
jgi:hypothetical protein